MGCATSKEGVPTFSEEGNCHAEYKLVIVGDMGVGKTSTLLRFTTGQCGELTMSTPMPEMKGRIIEASGKRIKLNVWDTVGQERFRTVSSSIYRHARGIVLMYDVCNKESLTSVIENWCKEADRYASENLTKILIGNKSDRGEERQISLEEVRNMLQEQELDWKVYEISALRGEQKDVDKPFFDLASLLFEKDKGKK